MSRTKVTVGTWEKIILDNGTWIKKEFNNLGHLIRFTTSDGFDQNNIKNIISPKEQRMVKLCQNQH